MDCFSYLGVVVLPLAEAVSFTALLQRHSRVQVPHLVRSHFKLEKSGVFRVTIAVETGGTSVSERFYGFMQRDGRIKVRRLALVLLEKRANAGQSLVGHALEVTIEPVGRLRQSVVKT